MNECTDTVAEAGTKQRAGIAHTQRTVTTGNKGDASSSGKMGGSGGGGGFGAVITSCGND